MLHEEVAKYRELSGDTNPDTPISRIGGYLDGYEKALEQEPCDVFDEYGNYKYPSDVELTKPNTATSMLCEDAVSRQAAIDEIRFGQSYVTKISPTGAIEHLFDKENKALEEAVERIEELPSVYAEPTRWIPVSERFPEENGDYLVTYEKGYAEDYDLGNIGIVGFEVDCESFGYWYEHFDRYTLGSLGSEWEKIEVIAWMPLPEPFEPQESEGTDAL